LQINTDSKNPKNLPLNFMNSVPLTAKEIIAKKLYESGKMNHIESEIRTGLSVALSEVSNKLIENSDLLYTPFDGVDRIEIETLYSVFKFLNEAQLTNTLSALIEESGTFVPANDEAVDLVQVLRFINEE